MCNGGRLTIKRGRSYVDDLRACVEVEIILREHICARVHSIRPQLIMKLFGKKRKKKTLIGLINKKYLKLVNRLRIALQ